MEFSGQFNSLEVVGFEIWQLCQHKWNIFWILGLRVCELDPWDVLCEHVALKNARDCVSACLAVAYIKSARSWTVNLEKDLLPCMDGPASKHNWLKNRFEALYTSSPVALQSFEISFLCILCRLNSTLVFCTLAPYDADILQNIAF